MLTCQNSKARQGCDQELALICICLALCAPGASRRVQVASEGLEPRPHLDNGGKETATVELTRLSSLFYTTPEFGDISLFRFLHYPSSSRVKFLSRFPPSDTAACTNDLASILTRLEKSDAVEAIEAISLTAIVYDYFDIQVLTLTPYSKLRAARWQKILLVN